ncbi:MAG: AAA family ATPase [Spirochaetaceae bacterium]|nr:AAA family ATPase [Spirochaetaceae bacterium]
MSISLPKPWNGEVFKAEQVGAVNFLVGPNGSGKSQFAHVLLQELRHNDQSARLLSTDRLMGMEQSRSIDNFVGDHFSSGYLKREFEDYRMAGSEGAGIDTILLLEERMDLRIQVEATLNQIFNREILLEWDSGYLMPRIRRRNENSPYRMDREECHGIKELMVLLTHLYNPEYRYLIVDEPELNLHPQFQAFYMNEVRKVAGDPSTDSRKKIIFLITHSPYIIDIRSEDDLRSIVSFDSSNDVPRQMVGDTHKDVSDPQFLSRLNAHNKQFFFSDNPIFVEGISDAQLVTAIMERDGKSVSAAGSCIIDSGGAEEVNQYVNLCRALGKRAHFLYDLDSLFAGNLRSCIKKDETVQSFLLSTGLGNNIAKYCGALDRELTKLIDTVIQTNVPKSLERLREYLCKLGARTQWTKGEYAKARTAVMTSISLFRSDMILIGRRTIEDVEGRLRQILTALKEKNIHVLSGGTIERYLPSYCGDYYELKDERKRRAVVAEIGILADKTIQGELPDRYGELYDTISRLPGKGEVDVVPVLQDYLSDYIHELQKVIRNNSSWTTDEIQHRLRAVLPSASLVFSVRNLTRTVDGQFSAIVDIVEMMGHGRRCAKVSDSTNAGMGEFLIVDANEVAE